MNTLYHDGKRFEAIEKTLSRGNAYGSAICSLKSKWQFYNQYHIVIASRECGDIKFLLGIGIDPSHIIACDIDYQARQKAKEYGVIISPYNDIVATVKWAKHEYGNIGTINVDLCFSLIRSLPTLIEILIEAPYKASTLFTFVRARDRFHSIQARYSYLEYHLGFKPDTTIEYQSWTKNSVGSPMCTVVYQRSRMPKQKNEDRRTMIF